MKNMKNNFDLFIIGGSINGVGIARDAVGRGLRVCLVDKEGNWWGHFLIVNKINSRWFKISRKL